MQGRKYKIFLFLYIHK